jgi:hypothetical protein
MVGKGQGNETLSEKSPNTRRAAGVAQMVKRLPSKCKALRSNSITASQRIKCSEESWSRGKTVEIWVLSVISNKFCCEPKTSLKLIYFLKDVPIRKKKCLKCDGAQG